MNGGPLSEEALDAFTRHLSSLCGRDMALDPGAYGHEMYGRGRGRYQWKAEGGRSSDYQGVALKVSMDPEIYFIYRNQIVVIVRVDMRFPEMDAALINSVDEVLSPAFKSVLHEVMEPYEGPI